MSEAQWVPKLGWPSEPKHPFNKQWDIFNTRKRIVLVSGSRKSGKTWAVLHRICRHLWETPGARIGIFAKSVKLAKDGGTWQELVDRTVPEWVDAGIGFDFTTFNSAHEPGPKTDAITKTAYFRVRNYYGGESECKLFSIDNDAEVAHKVKNKSFSMIYFIELSMFEDPRILIVTLPSLRMPHLRPKGNAPDTNHQWIADTNPHEDLGNRSWFFQEFYKNRTATDKQLPDEDNQDWQDRIEYYESMQVIEMFAKDNPYLTRKEMIELKMSCKGDQGLMDSYYHGIHGDGGVKKARHFADVFVPAKHVVGALGDADEIDINPSTTTLYSGWDIGASSNHALGAVDKWYRTRITEGRAEEISHYSVLDELCSFDEKIRIDWLAREFMKKMRRWDEIYRRQFTWVHWSDDSSVNVWRPTSGTFDYLEILKGSEGKIMLAGVPKPEGSVRTRVRILRRLLMEDRIFVSAKCVHVIEMLEECKRGDSEKEFVRWDVHKHTFDWLTYILIMDFQYELQNESGDPEASEHMVGI